MIRNQHWYNLNASRDYPFDGNATLLDDAGDRMPTDILVGLQMLIPYGSYVYVGGITVTPRVCTIVLIGTNSIDTEESQPFTLGTVTVPQPIQPYRGYAVNASYPGVVGWLTFGNGVLDGTRYSGRFSTPRQSLLSPRAARSYFKGPIDSIGKNNNPALTGWVPLLGGDDIEIVRECREIPEHPLGQEDIYYCVGDDPELQTREVVVFRLRDTSVNQNRNVFDIYKGPCGNRPENDNCGHPAPIEFLGPVTPDCCGNITIYFEGCAEISQVAEYATVGGHDEISLSETGCGVIIDCALGLVEACVTKDRLPDETGRLPNQFEDLCGSVSIVVEPTPDPEPEDPEFAFDEHWASVNASDELPFSDDFEAERVYVVRFGSFAYQTDGQDTILISSSPAMRNVATFDTSDGADKRGRRVSARVELLLGPVSALRNAAVMANFKSFGHGDHEYYVAELDWDGHYRGQKLLRIAKYTGTRWEHLADVAVPELQRDVRYDLSLDVLHSDETPTSAWLFAKVTSVADDSLEANVGPVYVEDYGPANGSFGIATNRANTRFRRFRVENITETPEDLT